MRTVYLLALPLGEVARRSRDGEGGYVAISYYRQRFALSVFSLRSNPALPEGEPRGLLSVVGADSISARFLKGLHYVRVEIRTQGKRVLTHCFPLGPDLTAACAAQEALSSTNGVQKQKEYHLSMILFGPSVEIRTQGLLNPIQARYQTSPHPDIHFAVRQLSYNTTGIPVLQVFC